MYRYDKKLMVTLQQAAFDADGSIASSQVVHTKPLSHGLWKILPWSNLRGALSNRPFQRV